MHYITLPTPENESGPLLYERAAEWKRFSALHTNRPAEESEHQEDYHEDRLVSLWCS